MTKQIEHGARAHAKLSASGAHGWALCAHWENEDTTSEFAEEGTAAHELSEACLRNNKDAMEAHGQVYNGFTVDEDMARYTQMFLDYVREHTSPDTRWLEQRVDYSETVGEDAWGTGDVIGYDAPSKTLDVIDLKYGQSPLGIQYATSDVEIPGLDNGVPNLQLGLYGDGALYDFSFMLDVERVRLHIVQPRLDHVSVFELSVEEIEGPFRAFMKQRAELHRSGDGPFTPEMKTCQWCARKADCKALAAFSMADAVEGFESLEDLDEDSEARDVSRMSNEEVAEILPKLRLIRAFDKALQARAVDELMNGQAVPGYKMVAGRGSRAWIDPEAASRALRRLPGITAKEVYEQKFISPAKAEKLAGVGKKHRIMTRYVERVEGSPSLAPESDPKPALEFNPSDGFENEEAPVDETPETE